MLSERAAWCLQFDGAMSFSYLPTLRRPEIDTHRKPQNGFR
jgi:hypothetical protein